MNRQNRIKTSTFTGLDVVKGVALHRILETTCNKLGVKPDDVRGKTRTLDITYARHLFCYIAYNASAQYTLKEIGKEIKRDHASVIHGKNRIANQIDIYKPVFDQVEEIKDSLATFIINCDYDNKIVTREHVGYYTTPERKRDLKKWCNENDVVLKSKLRC